MSFYFNQNYCEHTILSDGTRVLLRCVRPSDKHFLLEGLEHLSEQSRYLRFFTAKPKLSEKELSFLTEVDGVNHFAMGALLENPDPEKGSGVGIVRFIRLKDHPEVAEPAIVVIDEAQGKGLGRILFRRLIAAALERDITRFRCEVLATNDAARHLVKSLAPDADIQHRGTVSVIEFNLPKQKPTELELDDAHHGPLYHFFRIAARGELAVRNTLSTIKHLWD